MSNYLGRGVGQSSENLRISTYTFSLTSLPLSAPHQGFIQTNVPVTAGLARRSLLAPLRWSFLLQVGKLCTETGSRTFPTRAIKPNHNNSGNLIPDAGQGAEEEIWKSDSSAIPVCRHARRCGGFRKYRAAATSPAFWGRPYHFGGSFYPLLGSGWLLHFTATILIPS